MPNARRQEALRFPAWWPGLLQLCARGCAGGGLARPDPDPDVVWSMRLGNLPQSTLKSRSPAQGPICFCFVFVFARQGFSM